MEAEEFERYTERLRTSLESIPQVVGLVTLGSTADADLRDEWSDHDFWVITEPGAQDILVQDLSWLPDHQEIAITVPHGKNRRTLLFRNRHKAEFAVFDVDEARTGKIERYKVLIDRNQVAQLIEAIHEATLQESRGRPDALENLCVLAWSACERYCRGEQLSALQNTKGFAVNQLLSLISEIDENTSRKDALDPRRRLEARFPTLAAELIALLEKPVPVVALHLLEISERELKPKNPALAWDKVLMVRGWINELLRSPNPSTDPN